MNAVKAKFLESIKSICPNFVIDDSNRQTVSDVFHWCIRDKNGRLDPAKGLWIYGNIGTGKSTMMKAILEFVSAYWLRDSGERLSPKWMNVPMYCGKYATDGFAAFDSIPMGLDELGTEVSPTNHIGNKLNVVAHLINTIYDRQSDIPYIVTTNRSLGGILDSYGERTIDRIGQIFNLVEMLGATRRDTLAIWELVKSEKKGKQ